MPSKEAALMIQRQIAIARAQDEREYALFVEGLNRITDREIMENEFRRMVDRMTEKT